MTEKMTISRLAGAAGVNVETVRFYQRSGLIDEPTRPYIGYRTYADDDVRRIRFIKRAQLLGVIRENGKNRALSTELAFASSCNSTMT